MTTAGGGATAGRSVGMGPVARGCVVEVVVAAAAVVLAADVVLDFPPGMLLSVCLWISFRLSALNTDWTSHVATSLRRALWTR